jgi:hypothetical protein
MGAGILMIKLLMGWLIFPGLVFQILLAFVTAWSETFLSGLLGFRPPPTPFRFFLHWAKGFAKRPVPIRFDLKLLLDVLVLVTMGWLGLSVFSKHGIDGDIPFIATVLSLAATRRQPFSISRCVHLGSLIVGFSISGIFPGATFRLSDVMEFQGNYGPLIGLSAGALAALSTWIGLVFSISRSDGSNDPYPGPISTLSSFLSHSGLLWLWTACFAGGSWHGLSGLRMVLIWILLVLSLTLTRLMPPLRRKARWGINLLTGAAVLAALLMALGGRGS